MVPYGHRRFYRVLAAITAWFAPTTATVVGHAEPTASFALISRYIDTPVARFQYSTTGGGSPVVLLPGGTVSLHTYRGMIPALAEHHTVYAVDLPGNGYTTVNDPNFSYDLAAMTGTLCQFMAAVGLEDGACVVAHSLNGPVAVHLAATRDPRTGEPVGPTRPLAIDTRLNTNLTAMRIPVVGEAVTTLMT
ncbi:alpha/beta fold hydrolase [Nocardia vinacea]|uniref:alpha/beta fold hydrolase n=1 Tax=Nocardia vinacea TaxID=96468 RepID=UPI0002D5F425|nr:alpha/beta fold hydrolase [Nocardia vinacea]